MSAPYRDCIVLESGDLMLRDEFHRRYALLPGVRRAELIEGVVYMPSPVRFTVHDRQAALVRGWLMAYAANHPDVEVGNEATVFLDAANEVQPDAFLFRPEGPVRLNADGYVEGAPELVVEVAASSVSRDLHGKLEAYRRNGVQEYIVWRVQDSALDWFERREGAFVPRHPDASGVLESAVFPGLRLNVPALIAEDRAAVLLALR